MLNHSDVKSGRAGAPSKPSWMPSTIRARKRSASNINHGGSTGAKSRNPTSCLAFGFRTPTSSGSHVTVPRRKSRKLAEHESVDHPFLQRHAFLQARWTEIKRTHGRVLLAPRPPRGVPQPGRSARSLLRAEGFGLQRGQAMSSTARFSPVNASVRLLRRRRCRCHNGKIGLAPPASRTTSAKSLKGYELRHQPRKHQRHQGRRRNRSLFEMVEEAATPVVGHGIELKLEGGREKLS